MSGQKLQDQLKAERLAAELRANLKKRKARLRARNKELAATPSPEADDVPVPSDDDA